MFIWYGGSWEGCFGTSPNFDYSPLTGQGLGPEIIHQAEPFLHCNSTLHNTRVNSDFALEHLRWYFGASR
jgi:hypothetical protein